MNRAIGGCGFDSATQGDAERLVTLALQEDLGGAVDCTSAAVVPAGAAGAAQLVARQPGIVCGLVVVPLVLRQVDTSVEWVPETHDGARIERSQRLGTLRGNARSILTAERTVLNFVGRLSGVATLTSKFVAAIFGTGATIFDTRKTTPGWRRLEKYAVRCGGGANHRMGLYDGILIKDNHLALLGEIEGADHASLGPTVRRAQQWIAQHTPQLPDGERTMLEVEVDSLAWLREALMCGVPLILLDNMGINDLRQAVKMRNELAPATQLEASGGVRLDNVRDVAETGIDRISVGALTHSATVLDVALDWI
jgi:nicotinate-nucleotide pyrophosphorylase (carboxylating)